MCRTQCVLALLAISVGLTHSLSWDLVTAVDKVLKFYDNGTLTHSEDFGISMNKLTYDAVHNKLLFIDTNITQNFLLYAFDLKTMELHPLVRRNMNKTNEIIRSLAYDPVSELVFWIQSDAIFWFSLKPGFKNNVYGNLLMEFEDSESITRPVIVVDSCKGFIYWTTVKYVINSDFYTTIEKARLNGSDKEVVLDKIYGTINVLVIDQQTQKMYWSIEAQANEAISYYVGPPMTFSIECVDLDGKNRKYFYSESDTESSSHYPTALSVTNDSIYWANGFGCWKIPKNDLEETDLKPENVMDCSYPEAIYKIEDQSAQECEGLTSKKIVTSDESACIPTDESFRCNNYCIQGNCSISGDGQPKCRCDAGYSGQRCEVNVCQGYCLNDGECSLNVENSPICQCRAGYEGERCEISACLNRLNKHFQSVAMLRDVLNMDATHASQDKGVKSTCAAPVF